MDSKIVGEIFLFIWVLCTFIFFFIEIRRNDIFFIYFSFSSFLSLIVSIFNKNIEIQLVVFIITSLILIIFLKTIVDKTIEFNFNFKRGKYINDKVCIIIKIENYKLSEYKVLTKTGIYTARYILKGVTLRKFKICSIVHDDGNVILIR